MRKYIRSVETLYAKSPFNLIYEHIKKGNEAVHRLDEVVGAFCDKDMVRVNAISDEISDLEHDADQIKQGIRERLPTSVLIPLSRQDVLTFLRLQDSIPDAARDVAKSMTIREAYDIPPELKESIKELTKKTIEVIDEYERLVDEIGPILATSFRDRDVERALKLIPPVERLEHEIDIIGLEIGKKIFASEDQIGAVGIYHLNDVVKNISKISNAAARAADSLRTMIYPK
ncbi:MAG: TIGR00153 family protein [Halobacteriota archaeon]|nr:TIGR00153 family protein [Halobacteriota archaeon]